MVENKDNGVTVSNVTLGDGAPPRRERWPFSGLKSGEYFQCDDLTQHTAIRTAASRAQKKYGTKFSVRKVKLRSGRSVLRVYMQ